MTTLITRLFPDAKTAKLAADRLSFKGMPRNAFQIVTSDDDVAKTLSEVDAAALKAYSKGIAKGNAVLAVSASYKPLGARRITREVMARYDTVDVGNVTEEVDLPWKPDHAKSVMKDHPRFLTLSTVATHGRVSSNFGMSTVSAQRTRRSMSHGHMSRMFWPMPLLSKKPRKLKVSSRRTGAMSRIFWPMALVSKKQRSLSVIPGGGVPFSRLFGMKTTMER